MTFICNNGFQLALEDLSDGQFDCPGGEDEAIIPKILKRFKSEITTTTTTISPVDSDQDENCQSVWWEELLKALCFMIVGGLIEIILLYISKKLALWGAPPVERNNQDERQEDIEMNNMYHNNNPFLDSGLFSDSTRVEDETDYHPISTERKSGLNEIRHLFDPIQPIQ